jgi:hypothetical protein
MKKIVKLRENELKRMITESVRRVLNEEIVFDDIMAANFRKLPVDGYHKLQEVLDTWTPCNKELDDMFGDFEDFRDMVGVAYTKLSKGGYNRSAALIMDIMKNMDSAVSKISMLPDLIEEEDFRKNHSGQSLSDYNYHKARWNSDQGEVDRMDN